VGGDDARQRQRGGGGQGMDAGHGQNYSWVCGGVWVPCACGGPVQCLALCGGTTASMPPGGEHR
jgi:hypothetical protein